MVSAIKRFYGLTSIISLAIGMGIYIFFRNSNMLLFVWLPKLEFLNNVYIPIQHSVFSSLFLYNFPDALWFLSGILFLRFLWFDNKKWQRTYIKCLYGIAAFFEISQVSNKVPGTFDVLDLLFMGIAAFVEGLSYRFFINQKGV